jgi:predicted Zn-dependent protease
MTLRRGVAVGLLALLLAAGCARPIPYPPGRLPAPRGERPGGRRQQLALSPRQELAVGRRAYQDVQQELHGRILPADSPQVIRARRIVEHLARARQIDLLQEEINLRVHGYYFEWEVNVVRERQINAFCLPAGKMVVFTGILQITRDNDAYLATVLSHEMSHALAHHAS